ncbi:MAG: hypothetical protein KJP02_10725 [Octadecabacter sp.]|nr:hypothetical protein [Octadecabacter sp.]
MSFPLIAFIGLDLFFLAVCDGRALGALAKMLILDESDLPIGAFLRKLREWVAEAYRKNIQVGHQFIHIGYFM